MNERLLRTSKLTLKLFQPEKQLVIMCEANEHAVSYVGMIEDYTNEETGETSKF